MSKQLGKDDYRPRFVQLNIEGYEDALSQELRGMVRDYARQMSKVYQERVSSSLALAKAYPNDEYLQSRLTPEQIDKNASGEGHTQALEMLRRRPFEDITWGDVQDAREQDPEGTLAALLAMHEGAKDYIASGMYTANAVGVRTPYEKAQFGVIRRGFIAEWQPRGGIESGLVEMLAQSYVAWQFWLRRSFDIANHIDEVSEQIEKTKTLYEGGTWEPPRVSASEYLEQATQMADRYQRTFMRTLRQMRDLRRYQVPVTINNPQQVNIAADGGQQVNVQTKKKKGKPGRQVKRIKQTEPR